MKSAAIVRVMLREYPDRKSAMSEAKRLAIEHSEAVDVRSSAGGSAVLVSPHLLLKIQSIKTLVVPDFPPSVPRVKPSSAPRTSKPQPAARKSQRPSVIDIRATSAVITKAEQQRSARTTRMVEELRHAYYAAPSDEMASWASMVLVYFGNAFTRRIGNVIDLSLLIIQSGGREIIDLVIPPQVS